MNLFKVRNIVVAAVAVTSICFANISAFAADYTWKFQSFWAGGSTNQKIFEKFAVNVAKMSGDRISIEALPGGAIVPPGEMMDAVKSNIIQGMNGGTGYFVGKDPAFAILADINTGYNSPDQLVAWYWAGGGIELAREMYAKQGLFYLGPLLWGAESIPSKNAIRSIADFKGIKMRAPEGMGAAIFRKIGVGVSTLPGSEVYTALERGKIQATDWGTLGMNDELGYQKLVKYAIYPGIHSMPSADISMNLKVWNGLPEDLKAILITAAKEMNRDSLETNGLLDRSFVAKRDPSTLINWGDNERKELRGVAQAIWSEWGKKSPMAQRLLDSHLAFMKRIGLL